MRKLLWCLLLGSTVSYAGVIKIRNAGQPDAYVPTMDSDNTSNLTVKGKVVSPIGNITTVNATTVAATNLTGLGTVPVGSIIQSILTLAQFQAQAGTNWVLMNGASIVGSRLATITGWTNLPDATGRFLRTAGGDANPVLAATQGQGTAKNALAGVATLGSTNISLANGSAASAGAHTHNYHWAYGLYQAGSNNANPIVSGGNAWATDSDGDHTHTVSGTTDIGHSHTMTITSTDPETRPVNLTVNTFIRIN